MTAEAAAAKLAATHERLTAAIDALMDGPAWATMLRIAARCHTYSPNNVLLIATQAPHATHVLGYKAWQDEGRQVRSGERGISILAPILRRADRETADTPSKPPATVDIDAPRVVRGFRVATVFDISQTDGADLTAVTPTTLHGAAPLGVFSDLVDAIEAAGYTFGYRDDLAPANGLTDYRDHTVSIRTDLSGAQMVKTLTHELAHVLLHAPDVAPPAMTRPIAEVEAESVAYVVTAAHGIGADDYTVPYVAGWAGGDRDLIAATSTRVLTCAREILQLAPPPSPSTSSQQRLHTLERDPVPDLVHDIDTAPQLRVVGR
jgi:antirestriction protein ArdC